MKKIFLILSLFLTTTIFADSVRLGKDGKVYVKGVSGSEVVVKPLETGGRDLAVDGALKTDTITGKTGISAVTVDADLRVDTIIEKTSGAGVTIEGALIKDGSFGGNITGNSATTSDSTVVRTTGNQSIGGTKTFTSTISGSITGNSATTSDSTVLRTSDSTVVRTTGDQSIGGTKTFTGSLYANSGIRLSTVSDISQFYKKETPAFTISIEGGASSASRTYSYCVRLDVLVRCFLSLTATSNGSSSITLSTTISSLPWTPIDGDMISGIIFRRANGDTSNRGRVWAYANGNKIYFTTLTSLPTGSSSEYLVNFSYLSGW